MRISEELVALPESSAFFTRIFDEVSLDYPIHLHKDAFELTLTIGLSGTRIVGDSTNTFGQLDLVLIAPGIPHCWHDHDIRQQTNNSKVVVVHFSGRLFQEQQLMLSHFTTIKNALNLAKYGLELKGEGLLLATGLMNAMTEENGFEDYQRLLSILHLFGESKNARRLCAEGYNLNLHKEGVARIEKAYLFIQKNYASKLVLNDVAKHLNMTSSAFSHFFKKNALKSFTAFITELRLGRAARLLQFTDTPVENICYQSGFQNASNFHRSFQKKYHCTPLQFRKHMR